MKLLTGISLGFLAFIFLVRSLLPPGPNLYASFLGGVSLMPISWGVAGLLVEVLLVLRRMTIRPDLEKLYKVVQDKFGLLILFLLLALGARLTFVDPPKIELVSFPLGAVLGFLSYQSLIRKLLRS